MNMWTEILDFKIWPQSKQKLQPNLFWVHGYMGTNSKICLNSIKRAMKVFWVLEYMGTNWL